MLDLMHKHKFTWHTWTYTFASYIHTCFDELLHTYMAYIHTYIHTYMHACIYACTHEYAFMHTVYAYMLYMSLSSWHQRKHYKFLTPLHLSTSLCIHTYIQAIYTRINDFIHTYMLCKYIVDVYICIYINNTHIHIYICASTTLPPSHGSTVIER